MDIVNISFSSSEYMDKIYYLLVFWRISNKYFFNGLSDPPEEMRGNGWNKIGNSACRDNLCESWDEHQRNLCYLCNAHSHARFQSAQNFLIEKENPYSFLTEESKSP